MRVFWPIARIVAAVMIVAAVIAQLVLTIENARESNTVYGSDVPTVVANFLSFFTIQSNVAAAVALTIGAVLAWTKGKDAEKEPRWFATLLACVTTYMIVTGVVYNTLLRGVVLPQGATVAWSNEVLHVIIPIFLAVDLFLAPKRLALAWRTVWIVVAYPVVWAAYTLIRANFVVAPATGAPYWYPYPFLDPHTATTGGYLGVALYILGIAAAIVGVGAFVVWVGRWRARRAATDLT